MVNDVTPAAGTPGQAMAAPEDATPPEYHLLGWAATLLACSSPASEIPDGDWREGTRNWQDAYHALTGQPRRIADVIAGAYRAAQQPPPAGGDTSAIVDAAVKEWLDRRTATALATAPGIDDREQGKHQGIDDLRQRLDDYWYTLTPAILEAIATAQQPQGAPGDAELLKQAADKLWACAKAALVVEHSLDKPYEDDPRWSPWTRWVERPAREAHDLAMAIRKRLREAPAPQPAPELAAAMADARRYREALQIARSFLLEAPPSKPVLRAQAAVTAALEGK